jgi:hypothetical protein
MPDALSEFGLDFDLDFSSSADQLDENRRTPEPSTPYSGRPDDCTSRGVCQHFEEDSL